jgi:hypothetical protein
MSFTDLTGNGNWHTSPIRGIDQAKRPTLIKRINWLLQFIDDDEALREICYIVHDKGNTKAAKQAWDKR